MANINDFRRRRLAAAAGNPERESWWRYARWRTRRILASVTIGGLITLYFIARGGFNLIDEWMTPDYVYEPPSAFQKVDRVTTLHNENFRKRYSFWDLHETAVAETAVAETAVAETAVAETPVTNPPLH